MAKLSLSKRPGSIKRTVVIPLADGGEDEIEFIFKYRTKSEYGKLIDDEISNAMAGTKQKDLVELSEGDPPEEVSLPRALVLADIIGKSVEADADFVLKIAEGWDLAEEFSRESLITLMDMHASASKAISEDYRKAITEARIKN